MKVYVLIAHWEEPTILGVYSTEEKARAQYGKDFEFAYSVDVFDVD